MTLDDLLHPALPLPLPPPLPLLPPPLPLLPPLSVPPLSVPLPPPPPPSPPPPSHPPPSHPPLPLPLPPPTMYIELSHPMHVRLKPASVCGHERCSQSCKNVVFKPWNIKTKPLYRIGDCALWVLATSKSLACHLTTSSNHHAISKEVCPDLLHVINCQQECVTCNYR
ncbi:hypothetical protein BGX38DRAFT_64906 [Terfezia claveryi]|nr:hypothetical protein BGX38DRAFT_64906 [Terfezia claveryi]